MPRDGFPRWMVPTRSAWLGRAPSSAEVYLKSASRKLRGLMVNELAEDVREAVAAQDRPPVPAQREAEAAIAVMFGLGIAMLDVSPARRRELAENAGDQVEIIALGGRCWAAGDRL